MAEENKNPDEDLMGGHPAKDTNLEDPPTPQHGEPHPEFKDQPPVDDGLETVSIGGVDYKMPKEAAAGLQNVIDERDTLRREVRDFETKTPTPQPPSETPPSDPYAQLGDELFTDPASALKKFGAIVREETTKEVTERYTQDQRRQQFFTELYREHPDLKDDDDFVKYVMHRNWNSIEHLRGNEAIDTLADLTRKEILKVVKRTRTPQKGNKTATLEVSTGTAPSASTPSESNAPVSLKEAMEARRKARKITA